MHSPEDDVKTDLQFFLGEYRKRCKGRPADSGRAECDVPGPAAGTVRNSANVSQG